MSSSQPAISTAWYRRECGVAASLLLTLLIAPSTSASSYDDEEPPPVEEAPEPAPLPPEARSGDDRPLDAGGLAAPGALPERAQERTQIERELDEADEKDAGRGLEFAWLNGELGFGWLDATALGGDWTTSASGSGPLYGGAVGVRILYFSLGARFRMGSFDRFDTWSLLAEAGLRVPIGAWEPYVVLGAGGVQVSGLSVPTSGAGSAAVSAAGFDVRLALGTDYYLSDTFSVGAQLSSDLAFLSRSAVVGATSPALETGATSVGMGLGATALVGLHF